MAYVFRLGCTATALFIRPKYLRQKRYIGNPAKLHA